MSKPSVQFLAGAKIELPDPRYKADLELHDRFQSFSSELLKLALAGIAVFGLFLTLLGDEKTDSDIKSALQSCSFLWLSSLTLLSMATSVALSLLHRFLASDGLYHHFRAIKSLILLEDRQANPDFELSKHEAAVRAEIKSDEELRNKKFADSESALKASAIFLLLGAVLLGAAFVRVLL